MTLEELDEALKKLGLDLDCDAGKQSRDKIISLFGKHLQNSKKDRCFQCKSNKICDRFGCSYCEFNEMPDDPLIVGMTNIKHPNTMNLFSFICMFVIPVYEEETGQKNTLEKISQAYRKRWNKEHPEEKSKYD